MISQIFSVDNIDLRKDIKRLNPLVDEAINECKAFPLFGSIALVLFTRQDRKGEAVMSI